MEAKRKKTSKATENTKQVLNKKTLKSSSAKRPTSSSKGKNPKSKDTQSEMLFKKKLVSLSTTIDLIQEILKSTNMDIGEVQEMFRTIFNDINFFLKSLPQVKNDELLTAYNKTYKKLDSLIKSVNFNFDSVEIFQTDNLGKNTELDENNICIEKIKNNAIILYRIKYINEDIFIIIFDEDGKQVRHYKIKPDGNKEEIPVSINTSGGLKIEIVDERLIDESNFTVIDFIIVNRKLIKYIFGGSFDTTKNENITSAFKEIELINLCVINVLFENNALRNALSKIKNNKIFDFKLSINVSNLVNVNENNLSSNTDDITQEKEASHELLLLNTAFPKNQKSILAAKSQTGKSILSIEIGLCEMIKHPLYILIDDQSNLQLPLYEKTLGNKASIIDCKKFAEFQNMIENDKKDKAYSDAIIHCLNPKIYNFNKSFSDIYNSRLKTLGINSNSSIFDEVTVIESIVEAISKEQKIDFLCIDSLIGIFKKPLKITRDKIDRITKIAVKYSATLLVIHHTKSDEKEMLNSNAIEGSFENVYLLTSNEDDTNKNPVLLTLKENARFSGKKTIYIKRTFIDKNNISYELINKKDVNSNISCNNRNIKLEEEINQIILEERDKKNYIISLENLKKRICRKNPPPDGSIKNYLKRLKDKGLVSKTDGEWEIITINKEK